MAASFPGTVVTEPTAQIATNQTVRASHVDQLYLEVVAIEQILLGTLGASLTLQPATNSTIPLQIRGLASQSGNLLQIGSSASATDRLQLTPAGLLTLPAIGTSTGIQFGTSSGSTIFSSGGNMSFQPIGADATSAFRWMSTAGTIKVIIDISNGRLGVGSATVPSTGLHLGAATTPTTAAFGLQIGTEGSGAQVNFYRSAANTAKTDANFTVGGTLVIGAMALNTSVGGTYTGTGQVTVLAQDLEVRKSSGQSRLVLSSPNGTRFALRYDDDGQIITEVA